MMKQILMAVMLLWSATAISQTAQDTVYVYLEDQPNGVLFLPAPPDTASAEYLDDLLQFQWGKTQRNTPRGHQASEESLWTPDAMRVVMAEALGIDVISQVKTPALDRLLVKIYNTGNASTKASKEEYMRIRPFVQMNDPLWARYDDDFLRTNGSYPSGHTSFGWGIFRNFTPAFGANCPFAATSRRSTSPGGEIKRLSNKT